MFLGIERIDTDARLPITPISTSVFRHPVIDQHAVGAEHDHEAELHGVPRDVEDIGTDERLAAR